MTDVWTEPAFEPLARLLTARTGLAFTRSRGEELERATRQAMAKAQIASVDEFASRLARGNISFDDFVDDVTVGETYFFRDAGQFQLLEQRAIPDIRLRMGEEHVIRAWSAGCASGEEPYSMAILLHAQALLHQASILGTDISPRALKKARAARYGDWSLRGVDPAVIEQYFEADDKKYVLSESIRSRVSFRIVNLAEDSYPSPGTGTEGMDIILCRNVLIYFDEATIRRVGEQLFRALSPGGWLIAGACDPDLSGFAPFDVVTSESGICYKRPVAGQPRKSASVAAPAEPPPSPSSWAPRATRAPAQPIFEVPPLQIAEARPPQVVEEEPQTKRASAGDPNGDILAVLAIKAQWNRAGAAEAERTCAKELRRHRASVGLHYLHAALFCELNQFHRAARAAKRTLHLDRTLAIAHFLLATILERIGDGGGAARAYRSARQLSLLQPQGSAIALGDGISAGGLAKAAQLGLTNLASKEGLCG